MRVRVFLHCLTRPLLGCACVLAQKLRPLGLVGYAHGPFPTCPLLWLRVRACAGRSLGSVRELLRCQPEVAEPDAVVSAVGTKVRCSAAHEIVAPAYEALVQRCI